jgi:hypothetical protein
MQETWDITLPASPDVKNPEEALREALQANRKEIGILLSYHFKGEGAIAENVEVKDNITFADPHHGTFKVEFDLVYFNACLNIHEQQKDSLEIIFETDKGFKNLKLICPDRPERGMDEI